MTGLDHPFFGPIDSWIPALVVKRLRAYQGMPVADAWLSKLPTYLQSLADQWDLRFDPTLPDLSYNIVLFAESQTRGRVVLKLHPPSPEFLSELHALEQSQGEGIVNLVATDSDLAMMMLGRVQPGTALLVADLDDVVATRIAAQAMKRFWKPLTDPTHFHRLEYWFRELLNYADNHDLDNGPIPARLIRPALEISKRLFATSPDPVLLHGDLHHGNLLRNTDDDWTIIDPKGLVGDPAYDVATWMLNPWMTGTGSTYPTIARNRLAVLEYELNIPRLRLAEWAFVHAMLSICWSIEDESGEDTSNEYGAAGALLPIIAELRGEARPS